MYLNYFHFKEEPFNNTPDPRFLFLSRQHEEALASLIYGVTERKGFMTLIGDIGAGKTTICRALISRLDHSVDTSIIFNPMLSVHELLEAINDDFGNKKARGQKTVKGQIDALNDFLLKRLKLKKNAVVLIDEAQHLSIDAFEMLRMLSNLETENQKLLQIIFVGQKELEDKLSKNELVQLNQRIGIRYLLGRLSEKETAEYILHRLGMAGGEGYVRFDEGAFKVIFEGSGGVPRLINTICDRALLEGYAEQRRVITKKMVRAAIDDINGRQRKPLWMRIFGVCR